MKVAPVASTYARAPAIASSSASPLITTSAPYVFVASTFAIGASWGTKIVARMPASRAAQATACAWLPALAATTPAARSTSSRVASLLTAPRILNEPVRWRFSAFNCTGRPASRESVSEP
jgi:hypothetical protein